MNAAQNPLTPEAVTMTVSSTNLAAPERVLVIGAHPDDSEFGCGATLAKWTAAGSEVSVLVCTDGSKGTWDPTVDTAELVKVRQTEQAAAIASYGATGSVNFLSRVDGELGSGMTERAEVAEWIRILKPTVVIGHDPWKRYRLHPDHRHAGLLACEGIVAARDPKFFPDRGDPWRPNALLLFEADEPDHAEDVSRFVGAKYQALLEHKSQFETTMGELDQFRRKLEAKLRTAGEASGFEFAEIYKIITDL